MKKQVKTYSAKVCYFDKLTGEALIKEEETKKLFWIYACNIPGKKTWFSETACVYYDKDEVVEFYIDDNQIKLITPGKLDVEKWNTLKKKNLTFRCDKNGNPTSGLLAKTKGTKHSNT